MTDIRRHGEFVVARVGMSVVWALDRMARFENTSRSEIVRRALLAYCAPFLAVALALVPVRAAAQPRAVDVLELARTCVSEAGWEPGADCAALGQTLRGLAERHGVSVAQAARIASPRLARCSVSRRWLCGLRADARQPAAWPAALSWSAYRRRWLHVLDLARVALADELAPCAEVPRVWGSADDWRRARAEGRRLRPVVCGATRNTFGAFALDGHAGAR